MSKDLLETIRSALDMDEGEDLIIQTPQFERQDGKDPGDPPLTNSAMNSLRRADKETLAELGMQKWNDDTGLWLLPHEWHAHIPKDYPLYSILNKTTTRGDMPATPDKRFGMLSVGIVPDFERRPDVDGPTLTEVDND